MNWDIFYNPTNGQLDDKLFSPVHAHFPPEFYYQPNNELELQYGSNEADVSDFINSAVNWDEFSREENSSLELNSTLLNVKDSGSCSDSDVEMANMTVSNSSDPFRLLVIPGFCHQNDIC